MILHDAAGDVCPVHPTEARAVAGGTRRWCCRARGKREGATATNPSTGTDANQTNIRRGPSKTIDVSEELPCVSGMAILAHEG